MGEWESWKVSLCKYLSLPRRLIHGDSDKVYFHTNGPLTTTHLEGLCLSLPHDCATYRTRGSPTNTAKGSLGSQQTCVVEAAHKGVLVGGWVCRKGGGSGSSGIRLNYDRICHSFRAQGNSYKENSSFCNVSHH